MMPKPLKIGIDARMYGPKQTGIGTYIEYLIKELAKQDKINQYFIFLLPQEFIKFNIPAQNFQKIKVNSHWYSMHEQVFFLFDLLKYKLDLMHFTHFNLPIFYPRKFIVTIHDITPKFFPGHKMGKSIYRRMAYNLILKIAALKSSEIIVPSYKTKNDLINFYKVNSRKICVIYEGIKDKNDQSSRRKFLENYSWHKEKAVEKLKLTFKIKNLKKSYIFYVGVWRDHKNLLNLIKAFNILIKKYNFKGQLVLGGEEDSYYPETRAESEKLGLKDKVIVPGFLDSEKLTLFYQGASVFVLPSFYEGFGLVTLESLNHGTPVACSDIEPLKEILGDSALYFNPKNPKDMADKLWQVLSNENLQKNFLAKAQNILEKYDWKKMAKETLAIYKKVLED